MSDLTIPLLGIADGIALVMAALGASHLGIDPRPGWGAGRSALLVMGLVILAASLLLSHPRRRSLDFLNTAVGSERLKILFVLGHLWLIILAIYVWFITFGNWTTWTHTTRYYDRLADSFSKGYLHINIKPDAALLASPDPYSPGKRPPLQNDIWDMSFYNGKFYLYWGPVPALIILPLKFLAVGKITDNYLVFLFYSALLFFNSLLVIRLWQKLYPKTPAWAVFICIPLLGLMAPILWPISEPNIYDAAVGAAQLFFMGGIYWAISAFEDQGGISKASLFLAGLFWISAVGSRALYAITIVPPAALTIWWLRKGAKRPARLINVLCLVFPLLAGAMLLAWYNWARFGSPFEFGLRYQISIWNLNETYNQLFLPRYIFPNIIVYLFQPVQFIPKFPFIQPVLASDFFRTIRFQPPPLYYAGRVVGLVFSVPFLIVALTHFVQGREGKAREQVAPRILSLRTLVDKLLLTSFITGFALLLMFFVGSMRYLMDIISPLTLLSITAFWKGLEPASQSERVLKNPLAIISIFLVLLSISIGFLLAFSVETNRFQVLNPGLFNRISHFFSIFMPAQK